MRLCGSQVLTGLAEESRGQRTSGAVALPRGDSSRPIAVPPSPLIDRTPRTVVPRGLLFLDEIGELGADEQAMLLRAVEDKRIPPVGTDREVESDFQLIAGTNRDLGAAVSRGEFRDDLLARIDLWTFALPGLRNRPEDIEPNLLYELDQRAHRSVTPRMSPARRTVVLAAGIDRWDHPAASAHSLGITDEAGATLCDAVLAASRLDVPSVLPERIVKADSAWRSHATVEFYVDFETVNSLDDNFAELPAVGGQPLVFQIGCGHWEEETWRFAQWTCRQLTLDEEARIIDAWLAHIRAALSASGRALDDARIVHWSPAEPVNLETAYNSARSRHGDATWPRALPWFDFLNRVIRAEPVTVTGAFNFGLKSFAKAMHAAGLIETTWADGPTDRDGCDGRCLVVQRGSPPARPSDDRGRPHARDRRLQ